MINRLVRFTRVLWTQIYRLTGKYKKKRNSSAPAMELRLVCNNPSRCCCDASRGKLQYLQCTCNEDTTVFWKVFIMTSIAERLSNIYLNSEIDGLVHERQKHLLHCIPSFVFLAPSHQSVQIQLAMPPWWPLLELLSWSPIFKSSHCNSFEDQAPVDEIYGCPIFKGAAETWTTKQGC